MNGESEQIEALLQINPNSATTIPEFEAFIDDFDFAADVRLRLEQGDKYDFFRMEFYLKRLFKYLFSFRQESRAELILELVISQSDLETNQDFSNSIQSLQSYLAELRLQIQLQNDQLREFEAKFLGGRDLVTTLEHLEQSSNNLRAFTKLEVLELWSIPTKIPDADIALYSAGWADGDRIYGEILAELPPIDNPDVDSFLNFWTTRTVAQWLAGCATYELLCILEDPFVNGSLSSDFFFNVAHRLTPSTCPESGTPHYMTGPVDHPEKDLDLAKDIYSLLTPEQNTAVAATLRSYILREHSDPREPNHYLEAYFGYWQQFDH